MEFITLTYITKDNKNWIDINRNFAKYPILIEISIKVDYMK